LYRNSKQIVFAFQVGFKLPKGPFNISEKQRIY